MIIYDPFGMKHNNARSTNRRTKQNSKPVTIKPSFPTRRKAIWSASIEEFPSNKREFILIPDLLFIIDVQIYKVQLIHQLNLKLMIL